MLGSNNLQKLNVTFCYQKTDPNVEVIFQNLQLGIIQFSFATNLNKVVAVELSRFQLKTLPQNVFKFRDQQKIKNSGGIQYLIIAHIKDSVGKFNAVSGIQEDIISYLQMIYKPVGMVTVGGIDQITPIVDYEYDSTKSPLRDAVRFSKGTTNLTLYMTSQENDALDLSVAESIFIELDVYYY